MTLKQTFIKDGVEKDVSDDNPVPTTPGSRPVGKINRALVTANNSTSITLLVASAKRKLVVISNLDGNKSIFVKFQAASVDNLKNDICIKSSDPPLVITAANGPEYLGEICVIGDTGNVGVAAIEFNSE